MWAIALVTLNPPDFLLNSSSLHLYSNQRRSSVLENASVFQKTHSDQYYRSKCAAYVRLLDFLQDNGLALQFMFQNDWPCKSRLTQCSHIVSNPFMKVTSAEMPFPTPPKFRFKDPIFLYKPQFTFPRDV